MCLTSPSLTCGSLISYELSFTCAPPTACGGRVLFLIGRGYPSLLALHSSRIAPSQRTRRIADQPNAARRHRSHRTNAAHSGGADPSSHTTGSIIHLRLLCAITSDMRSVVRTTTPIDVVCLLSGAQFAMLLCAKGESPTLNGATPRTPNAVRVAQPTRNTVQLRLRVPAHAIMLLPTRGSFGRSWTSRVESSRAGHGLDISTRTGTVRSRRRKRHTASRTRYSWDRSRTV